MTDKDDNNGEVGQGGPLLVDRRGAARLLGLSLRTFDRMRAVGAVGPRPVRMRSAPNGDGPDSTGLKLYWRAAELREWAGQADDEAVLLSADEWKARRQAAASA